MTTYPRRSRLMQAHPVDDVARREREMRGERLSLAATVGVAGVLFAGFLLALPFVGLVVGAVFGIDMAVLP